MKLIKHPYWSILIAVQKIRKTRYETSLRTVTLLGLIVSGLSVGAMSGTIWIVLTLMFTLFCAIVFDALTMSKWMLVYLIEDSRPKL